MSRELWEAVDSYLTGLLVAPDPALDEALAAAAAAGLPPHEVSPSQGKLLHLLARLRGARRILEVGTLGGYSTVWLARALPGDGLLVTLELEPRYAAVAEETVARAGFADRVEVRVGPAQESLARLAGEEGDPFDLVFLDADKARSADDLASVLPLTRMGTLLVADNVVRAGEVANEASPDASVLGVRRFLELVAAEPRLDAVALQTVGVKGHDGFALALVIAAADDVG